MYIINMASGCTHEEASLVSLDDLDNISILLEEDNDFKKLLIYLMKYFYLQVFFCKYFYQDWKKPQIIRLLNVLKTCT